jgi:cbb3-type cytochrome oxidase subunit 3
MNQPIFRTIALGLLWLGFVVYAFGFAPPDQADTLDLIKRLSTAQVEGINPLIVALFNIMGVLPVMYACLLYADGRGQRLPAWAFSTVSFAVGAFALLPYLALRQPNPGFVGKKTWLIKLLDSRLLGIGVAIAAIGLVTYGITQGDWQDFVSQWKTSRFIHVMSLDFCLLCLLFPTLLGDDMARRGLTDSRIFWTVAFIPLFGAVIYLVLRPQLIEVDTPQTTAVLT